MKETNIPEELYDTVRVENILSHKDRVSLDWPYFTSNKVDVCEKHFGAPIFVNREDEYKTKTYKAEINGFTCYIRTAKGFGTTYEVRAGSRKSECLKFLMDFKNME